MIDGSRELHVEHPHAMGSFRSWLRLLCSSRSIDARFAPRLVVVSMLTLLTSPLRLYERIRYDRAVSRMPLHPSPIFIIGHWRTGTTFLHELLCQDPNLGWVSTFQAMAPGFCLMGEKIVKPMMAAVIGRLYPTRVIDLVPLSLDAPQEEEYAVASASPYSFLHLFTFPRQATEFFARYVMFRGLSDRALAEWEEVYLSVLRKATLRAGGKRLILKNPAHCGHLGYVLKLFPDAKFIYLARHPYDVFLSTCFLHETVVPRAQLQTISRQEIEQYVLHFYDQLTRRYLADRTLVPAGNLVELRFEDLKLAPLEQVRRIYERLGLPGFEQAETAIRAHAASVSNYQRNHYELTDETIGRVNHHWRFAFEEWGYEMREPSVDTASEDGCAPS